MPYGRLPCPRPPGHDPGWPRRSKTAWRTSRTTWSRTSRGAMRTTWPCWTPPMPMWSATASTCRKSLKRAGAWPTRPACSTHCSSWTGQGRCPQHHLGHRLRRGLQLAAGGHLRRQRQAPASARGRSRTRCVFPGLPWLSRRGSSFIWGVWHDAKHVAGHIATQRTYSAYRDRDQRAADRQQPATFSNVSTLGAH